MLKGDLLSFKRYENKEYVVIIKYSSKYFNERKHLVKGQHNFRYPN